MRNVRKESHEAKTQHSKYHKKFGDIILQRQTCVLQDDTQLFKVIKENNKRRRAFISQILYYFLTLLIVAVIMCRH